jgi:hypothetical protein
MGAASDDFYRPVQARHDDRISGLRTTRERGTCRHRA